MDKSELELQEIFLKEFDKYDERLWQKMPPARFSYWSKQELWTMVEFAYLLKEKEPLEKDDERVDYIPASFVTYFKDLARFVKNEILLCTLKPIFPYPDADFVHCHLLPLEWLKLAKRKGMAIPDGLVPILENESHQKMKSPDNIDPRERKTYLQIIAVLAKKSGFELNNPFSDADALLLMGEELGLELPKKIDTIAKKFREVKDML